MESKTHYNTLPADASSAILDSVRSYTYSWAHARSQGADKFREDNKEWKVHAEVRNYKEDTYYKERHRACILLALGL